MRMDARRETICYCGTTCHNSSKALVLVPGNKSLRSCTIKVCTNRRQHQTTADLIPIHRHIAGHVRTVAAPGHSGWQKGLRIHWDSSQVIRASVDTPDKST